MHESFNEEVFILINLMNEIVIMVMIEILLRNLDLFLYIDLHNMSYVLTILFHNLITNH
jgi:hypothetical protein